MARSKNVAVRLQIWVSRRCMFIFTAEGVVKTNLFKLLFVGVAR